MRHFGGQCHCALFSEVRILGYAGFTCKPIIDHQNGDHVSQSPQICVRLDG